jgi:hypothetical protein
MESMSDATTSGAATTDAAPSFPTRVGWVLYAPGRLGEALARHPVWAAALVTGAALVFLQTYLIPGEVWDTFMRAQAVQAGRELPEGFSMGGVTRAFTLGVGTLFFAGLQFVFAGLVTFIFSFVYGDEGSYKQYLSVTAHAWLIPALVGLCLVPLRISQQNPQFTLNLASFFYFLPEGYPLRVLTMLDLSQLWAWVVVALGTHAIDSRRPVGSAVAVLLGLSVALAMVFALLPGAGGAR